MRRIVLRPVDARVVRTAAVWQASRMEPAPVSGPGRPRDPGVDARVARAAAEVFGEEGWAGFTVDAVARRAGVGKASIYLRWPNKEALLAGALESRIGRVADIDTGSVRADLVALARQMLGAFLGESGRATIRLLTDADSVPGAHGHFAAMQLAQVRAARAIVHRGIHRGELHPGTNATLLLDAVVGGCLNHVLATPAHLRTAVTDGAADYAAELVDFVLGIGPATA
jgi:AcrR family transcriptional regulator